jgi:hypothetical protein
MNQIPTQGPRTPRVFTSIALIVFFLLTVVIVSFNRSFAFVRQASAAAVVPVTTLPPSYATITSPTDGTVYPPLTLITIKAYATSGYPSATITRVDFYSSTALIGTSTVAPYSITWNIPGTGFYALTVKAYDSLGSVITSAPVTIEVPFKNPPPPPKVSITSPTNNAVYATQTFIPINVSLTDIAPNATILKVEVYEMYNGTSLIATLTSPPFSSLIYASDPGIYTLIAKAYDNYGQVTTSAPITITAETAPFVSINAVPSSGSSFIAPANVLLTADVIDPGSSIKEVDFYNGNTRLGTSTSAPYTFTWTHVPAGNYTVTAVAIDTNTGLTGTSIPDTILILASPCTVSYQLSSQWSGGFSANIMIANTGTTTIAGWTLKFTFPGDQKITNWWSSNATQSGEQVTITNASWNSIIAPGGRVNLGFNGIWTSNDTNPTSLTINGQTCMTS